MYLNRWWLTFKTVEFNIFKFLYSSNICFSAIFSISPVNKTLKFLYFNLQTKELLFKIFTPIIFKGFGHKISNSKSFSILTISKAITIFVLIFFCLIIFITSSYFSEFSNCFPIITFLTLIFSNIYTSPSEHDLNQNEI